MSFPLDDFFYDLPEREREIALQLRELIRDNLPQAKEKLAYGAPFYHLRKRVCFIWPASIPWGAVEEGVALGFSQGAELSNEHGLLESRGRKQVASFYFKELGDIDPELIGETLREAALLDEIRDR